MEASAGYVFPFPNSRGKTETKKLMNFIFSKFIPENYKKIDLVIISVHWLMKSNQNLDYNENEIKSEILKTIAYLKKYNINYLILGQTETYKLSYPKILMLKNLGRNESEFINMEAYTMNKMLKNIIPEDNYIDLYENKAIIKLDKTANIPYMFDTNHLTHFGADQVLEIIKNKI
jgi:hypothetical protein